MSELLSKVAELLNAPESLVQRSAEARAEASGRTVDEVLQSWAKFYNHGQEVKV